MIIIALLLPSLVYCVGGPEHSEKRNMNQRHLYVLPLNLHEPPGVDILGESLDHQAVSVLVFLNILFTPETRLRSEVFNLESL